MRTVCMMHMLALCRINAVQHLKQHLLWSLEPVGKSRGEYSQRWTVHGGTYACFSSQAGPGVGNCACMSGGPSVWWKPGTPNVGAHACQPLLLAAVVAARTACRRSQTGLTCQCRS